MSQQTRIDQFYPSIINKKTPNIKHQTSNRRMKETFVNEENVPVKRVKIEYGKNSRKKSFSIASTNNNFSQSNPSTQVIKSPYNKSPINATRKRLFGHNTDTDLIRLAIEHLNLAKEGGIRSHNFDLEGIYSRKSFAYECKNVNAEFPKKYQLNDVNICDDWNARTVFTTILYVLSQPMNCGYFDENEIDFIYSIITLPSNPQILLARMIKRKRSWFRKSNITYLNEPYLRNAFNILVSRSICTFEAEQEDPSILLDLLTVDEIQKICKLMKVNSKGSKKTMIDKLRKLSKNRPLFPDIKNPKGPLYTNIFNILDYCVRITSKTWEIIDKILTLLIPNQDPSKTISDTFEMLRTIYSGETVFPIISGHLFPVFSSKEHLESYIKAKSILSTTLLNVDKKNWEKVQECGDRALIMLPDILRTESERIRNSILPAHVRRYMPGYTWLKVLSVSVQAFKKDKDKERVTEILNFLIEQNCHLHGYKGKWYAELALIEMYHFKNIDKSARIILQALDTSNLTHVDKINLIERANKILKRKGQDKSSVRVTLSKSLDNYEHLVPKRQIIFNTVDAKMMPCNAAGNKSVWCIENSEDSNTYGSVEMLACHYYRDQGFPQGLHCEGALPIILFFSLFWEELYDVYVPGAFTSNYQEAPSDLFTEDFYVHRKEKIDTKLQIIDTLNSEALSSLMEDKFTVCKKYRSLMSSYLQDNMQIKEIVCCLGVQGVVGICKRFLDNFKVWKAGFPDLIVWNRHTKDYKIVEVKGPRDVLSSKQRLWLDYLHQLGLNVEVCLVQDRGNTKKRTKATVTHDDCE